MFDLQPTYSLQLSDISPEYRDIAEAIGMDAFDQLTLLCGGQNLYIPKRESLERAARDREIRTRFNGGNQRQLASQYRLTERQVRRILKRQQEDSRSGPPS